MTNITNLRERTAKYKVVAKSRIGKDMAQLATEWQAAYDRLEASLTRLTGAVMAASANLDKKDEQIKMLRENLQKAVNHIKDFDGIIEDATELGLTLAVCGSVCSQENAEKALAATEPKANQEVGK